ncbi:MAG: hypothetical protein FWD09_04755 [Lentimicrobiaceae bacterium]|nr:hypothetical protein [Lentimicrobiaceae bacterium]
MKNIYFFSFCVFFFFLFLTCEKPPVEPEIKYHVLLDGDLDFNATGGEGGFSVSITSPATIENVESLAAWCQVTTKWRQVSTSGESIMDIIVTVDTNDTYEPRKTTVVVHMKLGENKASTAVRIMQEAKIEEGALINGIRWATRNVDVPGMFTANPEDAGMFYQWNRRVGWSATDPLINSNGGTTWNGSYPAGDTWEKANDPCPSGWRVPTIDELKNLANADSQWVIENGVGGRIFGSGDNLLFLPAVAHRNHSDGILDIGGVGNNGTYWSSTPVGSEYYACDMYIGNYNASIRYSILRNNGFSVRCVAE